MTVEGDSKILLTITEVAHRLGLGRSFVYELVMKGEVPSIKIGRARRVPAAALERFVETRLNREGTSQPGHAADRFAR